MVTKTGNELHQAVHVGKVGSQSHGNTNGSRAFVAPVLDDLRACTGSECRRADGGYVAVPIQREPGEHTPNTVTLRWSSVQDADTYEVEVKRTTGDQVTHLAFDSIVEPEVTIDWVQGSTYQWRVRAVSSGNVSAWSAWASYESEWDPGNSPFGLGANYPNPFSKRTTIPFSIDVDTRVSIQVYDVYGREVSTLFQGTSTAGRYEVSWEPGALPSGVYIVRLDAGQRTVDRRVLYLK